MNKTKLIFSSVLLIVFALIFGPAAYAAFYVQGQDVATYGYGYGHENLTGEWGYGYGYGDAATVSSGVGSGGGGSPAAVSSESQLIAYYENIISLLKSLLAKKSVVHRAAGGVRVIKVKSLRDISLTLRAGSRGGEVKALQQFLIAQAVGPQAKKLAKTGATGIFSKATEAALKEYQKANSIKATGIYGPATQKFVKGQLVQ